MTDTEHTFPLPDIETHKLDEVQKELRQPSNIRVGDSGHSNAWLKLLIGCALAVFIRSRLRRRNHA